MSLNPESIVYPDVQCTVRIDNTLSYTSHYTTVVHQHQANTIIDAMNYYIPLNEIIQHVTSKKIEMSPNLRRFSIRISMPSYIFGSLICQYNNGHLCLWQLNVEYDEKRYTYQLHKINSPIVLTDYTAWYNEYLHYVKQPSMEPKTRMASVPPPPPPPPPPFPY